MPRPRDAWARAREVALALGRGQRDALGLQPVGPVTAAFEVVHQRPGQLPGVGRRTRAPRPARRPRPAPCARFQTRSWRRHDHRSASGTHTGGGRVQADRLASRVQRPVRGERGVQVVVKQAAYGGRRGHRGRCRRRRPGRRRTSAANRGGCTGRVPAPRPDSRRPVAAARAWASAAGRPDRLATAATLASGPGCRPRSRKTSAAGALRCRYDHDMTARRRGHRVARVQRLERTGMAGQLADQRRE